MEKLETELFDLAEALKAWKASNDKLRESVCRMESRIKKAKEVVDQSQHYIKQSNKPNDNQPV